MSVVSLDPMEGSPAFRWVEGTVDQNLEHLRLVHEDCENVVAVVAPPEGNTFAVEFLVKDASEVVLEDVRRELDFYLVEKGERDPWGYAIYHCRTFSNAYPPVNWGFCPAGTPETERWSGIPEIDADFDMSDLR